MAKEQNLIQNQGLTPEELREKASKAGLASGRVRRAKRTLKEELLLLLAQGDTQERLSLALIEKAANGDLKAFEVIRDTIGQKPVQKQETDVTGVLSIELGGELKEWAK
jgi:hypothetical protein